MPRNWKCDILGCFKGLCYCLRYCSSHKVLYIHYNSFLSHLTTPSLWQNVIQGFHLLRAILLTSESINNNLHRRDLIANTIIYSVATCSAVCCNVSFSVKAKTYPFVSKTSVILGRSQLTQEQARGRYEVHSRWWCR